MTAGRKAQVRILGGDWRGRNLQFLNMPYVRPSPQRARGTLFNWLMFEIKDAVCLDLFAGSGVLSFEAISRGATSAESVERNVSVCAQIAAEVQRWGTDRISTTCAHARQYIAQAKKSYDIIFVDPPFHQQIVAATLAQLSASACVTPDKTLVYVEYATKELFTLPPGWIWHRQSRAGAVRYGLCRHIRLKTL